MNHANTLQNFHFCVLNGEQFSNLCIHFHPPPPPTFFTLSSSCAFPNYFCSLEFYCAYFARVGHAQARPRAIYVSPPSRIFCFSDFIRLLKATQTESEYVKICQNFTVEPANLQYQGGGNNGGGGLQAEEKDVGQSLDRRSSSVSAGPDKVIPKTLSQLASKQKSRSHLHCHAPIARSSLCLLLRSNAIKYCCGWLLHSSIGNPIFFSIL